MDYSWLPRRLIFHWRRRPPLPTTPNPKPSASAASRGRRRGSPRHGPMSPPAGLSTPPRWRPGSTATGPIANCPCRPPAV